MVGFEVGDRVHLLGGIGVTLCEDNRRLIEEDTPMTLSDFATAQLLETLRAGGGAELISEAVELVPGAVRGRGGRDDRRRPL